MAAARTQPAQKPVGDGWMGDFCDAFIITPVKMLGKGAWWLSKHPNELLRTSTFAGVLGAGTFYWDQQTLELALVGMIATPVVWAAAHHESFRQVGCAAIRDGWRRYTVYQPKWHEALVNCGLMKRYETEARTPKLQAVRGSEFFDRVTVKMLPGQDRSLFEKASLGLAPSFGSEACRVRRVEGKPKLVRLDFQRRDALAAVVPPMPIPIDEPVNLEAVPIGRTEYGDLWLLEILGTHVLVGGATGSGKASVLWSILRGIAPAVRDGLVELWGFDAKNGMELEFGKPMFTRYYGKGCEIQQHADGLRALVKVMEERSDRLAGMSRKHEPTIDDPLIVCVIDEMADLTLCDDKNLKAQINNDLAKLCRRARSVGISLAMFLQDPRKEAVPFRGLIPHGVGLRLKDIFEIDAVLGPGAYAAGANCTDIPGKPGPGQSVDGRGTAFMTRLGEPTPMRVRASFVTDEDLAEMALVYPAFKRQVVIDDEQEADDE